MQNTTHYNLKKPDYTDFADIQDINDNMDTIDEEMAAPTGDGRDQTVSFTDADLDSGITSFPTFLTKIVSGMKMAKFLRDLKAGMAYVLHVGSLVNNATCTESGKALDARMGKTLQDQITSLNDSLSSTRKLFFHVTDVGVPTGYRAVQVLFDSVSGITPILISDAAGNAFILTPDLSQAGGPVAALTPVWLANTNTIDQVTYATATSGYRIKVTYKSRPVVASWTSLDGRVTFNEQQFVQS